ncbi:MAG: NUDIX hydrolase [Brevundimonas sp.]|nr:MAG: NUDIX hydrolase [Brevundimonas sp.]
MSRSPPNSPADSRDWFDADRPLPAWDDGSNRPPAWRAETTEITFENPWLSLTRHRAVAPTGANADYSVMRPKNLAAGVLPLHADGTVILVGQQRFALMNYSWEMPEGGAPYGEDPLVGAQRELAEEAGLVAATWVEVLRMELSNSVTDERAVAWLAWDLSPTETAPDPTEVIASARVPFMALIDEIGRGAIRDAFTVATGLRAYHMAREGLLPASLAQAMLTRV